MQERKQEHIYHGIVACDNTPFPSKIFFGAIISILPACRWLFLNYK